MNDEVSNDGPRIGHGRVKWFDAAKGYGFVETPEFDGEVLLHINPLRNYGLGSVGKAAEIEFEFEKTQKGARITRVIKVTQIKASVAITGPEPSGAAHLEPVVIKWFDDMRGFGYVSVFKSNEEVFLHSAVLEKSEVAEVSAGQGLAVIVDRSGERAVVQSVFEWAAAGDDRNRS